MKLLVDDITAETRELSFAESELEINRLLAQGPMHEYRLTRPIEVDMTYYRAGTELFLQGGVAAAAVADCARCAEEFSTIAARDFRYVLAPKVIGHDNGADLCVEDLEFILYDGDSVELEPLVREQVLLALAERPLCREDCKGLCPHCGTNLNEAGCDCRKESADTRLAVLRTLKVKRA